MNKQPIRIVFFDPDRGWVEDTWEEELAVINADSSSLTKPDEPHPVNA